MKMDVEWVSNPKNKTVLLKFNSGTVWRKFCNSFEEFLDDEQVDEFGWGCDDE